MRPYDNIKLIRIFTQKNKLYNLSPGTYIYKCQIKIKSHVILLRKYLLGMQSISNTKHLYKGPYTIQRIYNNPNLYNMITI